MAERKKPTVNRRSLLLGAGLGAGAVGAVVGATTAVRSAMRPYITPPPSPEGKPPQIAVSFADSHPRRSSVQAPRLGAPNVVLIVLDDVGFSDLGCYGGEIATPHLDELAERGLRFSNFRTTAMCSCTRASLLTGLNHHSAGMGWLADFDSGYPGYRGDLTQDADTLAEVLKANGWGTFLVGKWHVNNAAHNGPLGPFHNWPTNRGFDGAYWFQGHSSDHFNPGAVHEGLNRVETGGEGYYLTDDLVDHAIGYVSNFRALAPERPFFVQIALGAAHSPLQARAADRDAYTGRYDVGWDEIRTRRLARQKMLGVTPQNVEAPDLSFGAKPWSALDARERRIYARYMEVYAGMVSAADRAIGRFMSALREMGTAENTLVIVFSDNGGSGEGTETGTPNIYAPAMGRAVSMDEVEPLLANMGEEGTFPHYPMGWANASNTPYRLYKQYTALGGVADPLIVSWPGKVKDPGAVRGQFVHVVDLFPTILAACGVKRPAARQGRPQKPLEGASVLGTLTDPSAPTRNEQYFELGGFRAYMEGRWRAVAQHTRGAPFEKDHWALYDLDQDPNERHDVADAHPDVLSRLQAKFDAAARLYGVYPLDDRPLLIKMGQARMAEVRRHWDLRPPFVQLALEVAPNVCGFDHQIEIEVHRPDGDEDGVLLAHGSAPAGFVLYIQGGRLVYETSLVPWTERIVSALRLPAGRSVVGYRQVMTSPPFEGRGELTVNGRPAGSRTFREVLLSPSYDGFSVGQDLGARVSAAYAPPFAFKGEIRRLTIDIDPKMPNPIQMLRFVKRMKITV